MVETINNCGCGLQFFRGGDYADAIGEKGVELMANPVETAYNGFEERAAGLKGLVEDGTDKQLTLTVQTAFASLEACAEFVLELEDQSHAQLNKKLAAAGKSPNLTRQMDVLLLERLSWKIFRDFLNPAYYLRKERTPRR
jgi:hypothetical protein